jgi:hypothetical protein
LGVSGHGCAEERGPGQEHCEMIHLGSDLVTAPHHATVNPELRIANLAASMAPKRAAWARKLGSSGRG